jgi:hypothetical protein
MNVITTARTSESSDHCNGSKVVEPQTSCCNIAITLIDQVVGLDANFDNYFPLVYQAVAASFKVFKCSFSDHARLSLAEVRDNGERFGIDSY